MHWGYDLFGRISVDKLLCFLNLRWGGRWKVTVFAIVTPIVIRLVILKRLFFADFLIQDSILDNKSPVELISFPLDSFATGPNTKDSNSDK